MSQTLYRFWNADGDLLYVGITARPWERWKQHAGEKPWWGEVERVTLESHGTRDEVRAAELVAIRSENPRYNIAGHYPHAPVGIEAGRVLCRCGDWAESPDRYVDHVAPIAATKATAPRRPSVKFVRDAWPSSMHREIPRKWQEYAREWLADGLSRAEIKEAMEAARIAWFKDETQRPWAYATGVIRRLIREKSEGGNAL